MVATYRTEFKSTEIYGISKLILDVAGLLDDFKQFTSVVKQSNFTLNKLHRCGYPYLYWKKNNFDILFRPRNNNYFNVLCKPCCSNSKKILVYRCIES